MTRGACFSAEHSAGAAIDTPVELVYYRANLTGCSALPPATQDIHLGLSS